jgi:hypothetical protein
MTPPEALAALDAAGIVLRADAGRLFASPSPVPPHLAALIRQHKEALLPLVARRQRQEQAVRELDDFFPGVDPLDRPAVAVLHWEGGTAWAIGTEHLQALMAWAAQKRLERQAERQLAAEQEARARAAPQRQARRQGQASLLPGSGAG